MDILSEGCTYNNYLSISIDVVSQGNSYWYLDKHMALQVVVHNDMVLYDNIDRSNAKGSGMPWFDVNV